VGGVLTAVYEVDGGLELAEARQRPDGSLLVRAPSEEAIERVRFTLGLQDDHSEFVRRFSRDPFLGATVRRLKGLRPLRCATVTHALLRALCGQLITARRAREIERRVVRAATPSLDGLHAAPTPAIMGRYSPAELRSLGLGGPRASALVRLVRSRAPAGRLDRRSSSTAGPRVANRPLVGRCGLPRGPWPLRTGACRGPRVDQAPRQYAWPTSRRLGDRGAARALRRMGRTGERLHACRACSRDDRRLGSPRCLGGRLRPLLEDGRALPGLPFKPGLQIRIEFVSRRQVS
jgi:hypothetical protein